MSASRFLKYGLLAGLLVFIIAGLRIYEIYSWAFKPNVFINEKKPVYLFVYSNWNYDSVFANIQASGYIRNSKSFDWTAKKKNYPSYINPGRYKLENRMSNNELINKLRSGKQDLVDLTFIKVRTLKDLSVIIAGQIEPTPAQLYEKFRDTALISKYGFNRQTLPAMFVPNTYEFYWNTSADRFMERMNKEYANFWNRSRRQKADKLGLTPVEVITLASIVEEETNRDDEKVTIAGVYINRLDIGMRLQADPTVKFAWNDFAMRRVLKKHYEIDSPYNTYKYAGLPPGPICMPEISSIDAVLNYEKHDYLYFCAKADFSGYHAFARNLNDHNKNARAYQRELNKRRIYN